MAVWGAHGVLHGFPASISFSGEPPQARREPCRINIGLPAVGWAYRVGEAPGERSFSPTRILWRPPGMSLAAVLGEYLILERRVHVPPALRGSNEPEPSCVRPPGSTSAPSPRSGLLPQAFLRLTARG